MDEDVFLAEAESVVEDVLGGLPRSRRPQLGDMPAETLCAMKEDLRMRVASTRTRAGYLPLTVSVGCPSNRGPRAIEFLLVERTDDGATYEGQADLGDGRAPFLVRLRLP